MLILHSGQTLWSYLRDCTRIAFLFFRYRRMVTAEPVSEKISINLSDTLQDLFLVLTPKEKEILIGRFSLNNEPKRTLESIGSKFNVTRERVRQIENIAINKLRRNVTNSSLQEINALGKTILKSVGGLLLEDKLVSYVYHRLDNPSEFDRNIIRLALRIDEEIVKQEKTSFFNIFWYVNTISRQEILDILEEARKNLKQKGDVISEETLIAKIMNKLSLKYDNLTPSLISSTLETDTRLKRADDGWGLSSWRHINPKSIRDKAYIILKKAAKPLHFIDISNKIIEAKFDKKMVTTQAVHNELIRYDKFVLIGRGLYALKEWGYESGTVSDIISAILEKRGEPMTKKEIVAEVLKQRKIKIGTISLNLQNNPKFVRVGRAVYTLYGEE